MAKTNKPKLGEHTPGPTMAPGSGLPMNPSDHIVDGSMPLPILLPSTEPMRRPFSEPTRPPMHWRDGPGPDEITSGRYFQSGDFDEGRYGSKAAEGGRRPTSINDFTTNGVEIRGTC